MTAVYSAKGSIPRLSEHARVEDGLADSAGAPNPQSGTKPAPIRAEFFGVERLAEHAHAWAQKDRVLPPAQRRPRLFPRLAENERVLLAARTQFGQGVTRVQPLSSAAEWLLDNFYIVQEQLREIKLDLSSGYYHELPTVANAHGAGYPRVYGIALELIAHSDSRLDAESVTRFVTAYQTVAPLTLGELWAVAIMLRLGLVENLRRLVERSLVALRQREAAEAWARRFFNTPKLSSRAVDDLLASLAQDGALRDPTFDVQLLQLLRDADPALLPVIHGLEGRLRADSQSATEIMHAEHLRRAAERVSVENVITSMRTLAVINWPLFVESTSLVERVLRDDPPGVYERMDFATRDSYRRAVERVGKRSHLAPSRAAAEQAVARSALALAQQSDGHERQRHIGYYLVGRGRVQLEAAAGYLPTWRERATRQVLAHPTRFYAGLVGLVTLGLLFGPLAYAAGLTFSETPIGPWMLGLVVLLSLIPGSAIAVSVVNQAVSVEAETLPLPKLEFQDGLSPDCRTMVVVPALISRTADIQQLFDNLEIRYLANRDANLHFALLGDFADAHEQDRPEDAALLAAASVCVQTLNARHGAEGQPADRFYYFHRRRNWNEGEQVWMGWERKRGKLTEFNRLLRGVTDTNYSVQIGDLSILPQIKYVITLDADTELPLNSARRLVGTAAHPLNRAVVDPETRRVLEGYSIIQPRTTVTALSAAASRFAQIFAGDTGLDPYATTSSDVYQDLFGAGSYVGKAIYDVDALRAVLEGRFPQNLLLSHDLLEGAYARAGLATDIQLLEDFPTGYDAYTQREHRWIRGDWQISDWLFPSVGDGRGQRVRNPLPLGERLKIFDNLRRSLLPASIVLFFVAGWTVLPGSPTVWTLLALFPFIIPQMITFLSEVGVHPLGETWRAYLSVLREEAILNLTRACLYVTFVLYQAVLSADAIARVYVRRAVTHRHLLKWNSAAKVERGQAHTFTDYILQMWSSPLLASLIALLLIWVAPGALLSALPLLVLWGAAPLLAFATSRPLQTNYAPLSAEAKRALRVTARKIWRFYETFAGADDHYLPPDNFQAEPLPVIAHRTSPTNIGFLLLATVAAHDFGYIGLRELAEHLEHTLATLQGLERYRGHFYNWYDTVTLQALHPQYISTVDSGNLAAALVVIKQACLELADAPVFAPANWHGLQDVAALLDEALRSVLSMEPATAQWCSPMSALALRLSAESYAVPTNASEWTERLDEVAQACEALTVALSALQRQKGSAQSAATTEVAYWCGQLTQRRAEIRAQLQSTPQEIDALRERLHGVAQNASALTTAMDFGFLFDAQRELFSVGFNRDVHRLDNSFYDLLASEARLASFLAIALGQAPVRHWFKLGRPLTHTAGRTALLSWGGTMFEYLMPSLWMHTYDRTLLHQTCRVVVLRQIGYGKQRNVPWGISESGYYARDVQQNYRYRTFGVPDLGLRREPEDNLVIAPYASFLALPFEPQAAWQNLQRLAREGAIGEYGYCEALDYTSLRRPKGRRFGMVRSYMAHHQGMSLCALDNCLNAEALQRRFHKEPIVLAAELLLQEKLPRHVPIIEPQTAAAQFASEATQPAPIVTLPFTTPYTLTPRTHLLSNGAYAVMVTNAGGGYSTCKDVDVTRWQADVTCDPWGSFIYIRDIENDVLWSTAYQPVAREPEAYEVIFSLDKASFRRRDAGIETLTEIAVSPEDNVEVRRVRLTNDTGQTRELQVTSYAEVVLAGHNADAAHPAFSKLFVESEFLPGRAALLFKRRPQAAGQTTPWALHLVMAGGQPLQGVEYETDRARFLGRGRTPRNAEGLHRPLSNTVGAVLDPVMSLRCNVRLAAGEQATLAFVTGLADAREHAEQWAAEYCDARAVERVFDLSAAQSQVLLRHLGVDVADAHLFQRLASRVLYPDPVLRAAPDVLARNTQGQAGLFAYGISGDHPIVLVKVDDPAELPLVRQALLAHEYWRLHNLRVDLVIVNGHPATYGDPLHDTIQGMFDTSLSHPWVDKPGGVFLRRGDFVAEADKILLDTVARVILDGERGTLADHLERSGRFSLAAAVEERPAKRGQGPTASGAWRMFKAERRTPKADRRMSPGQWIKGERRRSLNGRRRTDCAPVPAPVVGPPPLFFNGLGGFDPEHREYVIVLAAGQWPPTPWSNVLANEGFGCLVSESGLGYTWAGNSQLNRLTPWSNDPVSNPSGEAIYLRDEASGDIWSATPQPIREDEPYVIRHGAGYTRITHTSHSIAQELTVFVSVDAPIKILRLKLRSESTLPSTFSITSYSEWVLGVTREQSQRFVVSEYDQELEALFARNTYNTDFRERVAFVAVVANPADQLVPLSFTADRTEFIGRNGSLQQPAGLAGIRLSGRIGAGLDPCAVLQVQVQLQPQQEKEIVFLIGEGRDEAEARALIQEYRSAGQVQTAFDAVQAQWNSLLGVVQVKTPDAAMDLLLNQWLLYQTLACRVWGRSALYQSGGAYGYRDQLQDVMALVFAAPQLARAHILRAAEHQFSEGDVLHWWHPPSGAGVRTRCSDDYLWLPYVTGCYVEATGDTAVLDAQIAFLDAPLLQPDQNETYLRSAQSDTQGTLYEHCTRALDRALTLFGANGLPLMGIGDWNDGMNTVGAGGQGESVWVGWFLYDNLMTLSALAKQRGDQTHAQQYCDRAAQLKQALDEHSWDGEWYRRAYFDDGTPLGSAQNDECRIDSLAQSWATISRAAPAERALRSLRSAEKYLVDEPNALVKLLAPPFDDGKLDPGYIKGYVPGIRENGGQYTHGALWLVLALAMHGDGDRAAQLFALLNPINHTLTEQAVARYQVEPYVVAADVYSHPQHIGRGGWTWYTGSAGWMYRIGIENILGLKRHSNLLSIEPCVPHDWKQYQITYRYGATPYVITVENPDGAGEGRGRTARVEVDGSQQESVAIALVDDGRTHHVAVTL
jgi:cellobiose phosphorylase